MPYKPQLNPISEGYDGNYSVSWFEGPSRLATTYTLQEAADDACKLAPRTICTTAQQSCDISGKQAGTYFYCVRGENSWGYGEWSNVARVQVLPPPIYRQEAENYDRESGTRLDGRVPGGGKGIHIGGDNSVPDDESGWVEYRFQVTTAAKNALISMRYADDVAGDTCRFLLDGKPIGSMTTRDTGTWDDFVWTDPFAVPVGLVGPGSHVLRLEVRDSGSYGLTIDKFLIYEGASG